MIPVGAGSEALPHSEANQVELGRGSFFPETVPHPDRCCPSVPVPMARPLPHLALGHSPAPRTWLGSWAAPIFPSLALCPLTSACSLASFLLCQRSWLISAGPPFLPLLPSAASGGRGRQSAALLSAPRSPAQGASLARRASRPLPLSVTGDCGSGSRPSNLPKATRQQEAV